MLEFLKKKKPPPPVRKTPMIRSGFTAGKWSVLNSGWSTQLTTPNEIARVQLNTLKARSNEQYQSNGYCKRYVTLCTNAVVGPQGFGLIGTNKTNSGDLDNRANDAVEEAWKGWANNCTLGGSIDWFELQNLFISTMAIDGEFLARIYRGAGYGPYGFQIQPIESGRLETRLNLPLRNGNFLRLGIEYNEREQVQAYYIRNRVRSKETVTLEGGEFLRIPAEDMIHCYRSEQVGQSRGWPWMATALESLNNLNGFQEAALVAARMGACSAYKLVTPTGSEFVGTDNSNPDFTINGVSPGQIFEIPSDYDLIPMEVTYPQGHYDSYVKSTLQGIASALNVSYNALASDLEGVSYSSIRVAVLEDRDKWKSLQQWMTNAFLMPLYNEWLKMALLNGMVPGYVSRQYDQLDSVIFQGRRWTWVDPLKDIQAARLAVELGVKSRSDIIRESGKDPVDVATEIEKEDDFLKSMELNDGQTQSN